MIYTITGDDGFAVRQRLRELEKKIRKDHSDLAVERLDAADIEVQTALDAILGVSLFDSQKLVIVRDAVSNKELAERILEQRERIPETSTVVLTSDNFDKRAKYYKQLKKDTEFEEYSQGKNQNLGEFARNIAKQESAQLSARDAQYLVERVGTNKLTIASEIKKLATYNKEISHESIDLLTEPSPQSTIFQLVDAAFAGNYKKAATLYDDQRTQRVEPLAILGMLAWQLQAIACVKLGKGRSDAEIAKQGKLSPFVVQKSRRIADKLSKKQLTQLVDEALELDVSLKTKRIDPDESMHHFLLRLSKAG